MKVVTVKIKRSLGWQRGMERARRKPRVWKKASVLFRMTSAIDQGATYKAMQD